MRSLVFGALVAALLGFALARPFVGVLVWNWISFMNPHREVWGIATGLPWAQASFMVTVLGCVLAREPKQLPLNTVTVLLCLFALGITGTSLIALSPPSLVWPEWIFVIKIIAGVLLTAAMLTSRDRIHALIWLIAISLGFYGVKGGLFTVMTGGGFIVGGPADSMIADRNHIATAMLVSVPLMNYLRLQSPRIVVRHGIVFAMVTTTLAAIGTQSRGALVALIATALVFWFRSKGKLVSAVIVGVVVIGVITFMPDSWVERMQTIREFEGEASAMGRVRIWEACWRIALARPLTGGGFRAMYEQEIVNVYAPGITARAAHSIWFETLGEHGFIVFAIWLGILVAGGVYSLRIARLAYHRPELRWAYDLARMAQVSMVAFASGGSFLSLQYWDVMWTLMISLAAAHGLVRQQARQPVAEADPVISAGWRGRDPLAAAPLQRAGRPGR